MVSVQPIINQLSQAATFLVLTINKGKESQLRDILSDFSSLIKTVGFRVPQDNLNAIVGISLDGWNKLSLGPKPINLHKFPELKGEKHHAPSSAGDIFLHIRSGSRGSAFELEQNIIKKFAGTVNIIEKVEGFLYFDQRDLLGFVDGSENPVGQEALNTVYLDDQDTFAGGSYVYIQKYIHDIKAWEALSVNEQEKVIGRTKLENIEFDDDIKPKNAHNALNSLEDGRKIYRANMPFGDPVSGEYGTFFIGYTANPDTIETMLKNMFIGDPVGNTDRILDYSTAKTGTAFFVPSIDFLENLSS